jgi:hypothetical protein
LELEIYESRLKQLKTGIVEEEYVDPRKLGFGEEENLYTKKLGLGGSRRRRLSPFRRSRSSKSK